MLVLFTFINSTSKGGWIVSSFSFSAAPTNGGWPEFFARVLRVIARCVAALDMDLDKCNAGTYLWSVDALVLFAFGCISRSDICTGVDMPLPLLSLTNNSWDFDGSSVADVMLPVNIVLSRTSSFFCGYCCSWVWTSAGCCIVMPLSVSSFKEDNIVVVDDDDDTEDDIDDDAASIASTTDVACDSGCGVGGSWNGSGFAVVPAVVVSSLDFLVDSMGVTTDDDNDTFFMVSIAFVTL